MTGPTFREHANAAARDEERRKRIRAILDKAPMWMETEAVAARLGLSRDVARRILTEMADAGLILRRPAVGVYSGRHQKAHAKEYSRLGRDVEVRT